MLRTKTLNQLLSEASQASDDETSAIRNCFVCTLSGSLIAYSHPPATPLLERQAILAANIWTTYTSFDREQMRNLGKHPSLPYSITHPGKRAVTVELPESTLAVRYLRENGVLVCAIGPAPPAPPTPTPAAPPTPSVQDTNEEEPSPLAKDTEEEEPLGNGQVDEETIEGLAEDNKPSEEEPSKTGADIHALASELDEQAADLAEDVAAELGDWSMPPVEIT